MSVVKAHDNKIWKEGKSLYDAECKKLLSDKAILARILHACAEEFYDIDVMDIQTKYIEPDIEFEAPVDQNDMNSIIGDNTEDKSVTEHTIRYDLKFRVKIPKGNGYIGLIINLEAQRKYKSGYSLPKKEIYYASEMISAQTGTIFKGMDFNIKKFYNIWIFTDLGNAESAKNTITSYQIGEIPIVGNRVTKREDYDIMEVVLIGLGDYAKTDSDFLKFMDMTLGNEYTLTERLQKMEQEYGLEITEEIKQAVTNMCKAMDMRNEAAKEYLRGFRLLDDDFMRIVFDNNIEATELLLNVFFDRYDMKVIHAEAQMEIKGTNKHSVRLDIYATDSENHQYDIELRRHDRSAGERSARLNSSLLDLKLLQTGQDLDKLPDSYVIFITENDVFKRNRPIYRFYRRDDETGELFDDGSHIIYVNGAYQNEDNRVGQLMHDFRAVSADEMYNKVLADRVRYFKEDAKGIETIYNAMEDIEKYYQN